MSKKKVLVLCVNNSARSQMAEGLIRHYYGDRYEVVSAGVKPTEVHPYAIEVMREIGIDISGQHSKHVREFAGMKFDYVLTVCGHSNEPGEECPFFPGGSKYIHRSFEDPSKISGERDKKLEKFREVRDQIRAWIDELFGQK
jgi:arsenate reductase